MTIKVPIGPPLPRTPGRGQEAIVRYLDFLNSSLYTHFRIVGERLNLALPLDGTEAMTGPLVLKSYTVAGVPAASLYLGAVVYISNEAGGATIAFSDGANWRRVQDRVVIS